MEWSLCWFFFFFTHFEWVWEGVGVWGDTVGFTLFYLLALMMRSSRHTCESDRLIDRLINVFWKCWHAALPISFWANLRPHSKCRIACSTTMPQSHFFISLIVKVLQPLEIFQLGSLFWKSWHAFLNVSFKANLRQHFWCRIA